VPSQIFDENLTSYAVTPIRMPDVFEDEDGMIVEYRWSFSEGVNLDGEGVSLTSDFTEKTSFESNPFVTWKEPGTKNVTLEVVDDDGSMDIIRFEVIQQQAESKESSADTSLYSVLTLLFVLLLGILYVLRSRSQSEGNSGFVKWTERGKAPKN